MKYNSQLNLEEKTSNKKQNKKQAKRNDDDDETVCISSASFICTFTFKGTWLLK